MQRSKRQMLIGGIMLVVGWLTLLAGVVEIIPSFIWLNMVAYALTIVGFLVGMFGAMIHARMNIHKKNQESQESEEYDDYEK